MAATMEGPFSDPTLFGALFELQSLLSRTEFPQNAKDLLLMLSTYFTRYEREPLLPFRDNVLRLIDEFIFCCVTNQNYYRKRLSAVQELQLLELLCGYFENQPNEIIKNAVFDALFCFSSSRPSEDYKRDLLYKLVSLAVAVKCTSVLNCTAVWMSRQHLSHSVINLAAAVVHDYCILVPASLTAIQNLVEISPLFACQFLTAVAALYKPALSGTPGLGKQSSLPITLLEVITEWVSNYPLLCLSSLYPKFPNIPSFQRTQNYPDARTPIPGLITCCVLAPLNMMHDNTELTGKNSQLYSKLHLGVLEAMIAYKAVQQSPGIDPLLIQRGIVSLQDMKEIADSIQRCRSKDCQQGQLEISVDRMAQSLQLALSTHCLVCTKDHLKDICICLPQTRLLQIVLSQPMMVR
ncbi:integrator complex subunit 15-like [Saccoglossus kowalevskii]|uniref:Uncharacterized protein C7orf26-like n=1 Tax=Saccoglossus kowalevskii TaxID=10224 RepID=A0ABM0MWN6_SACKO|nr:PREDICTED: uncharacterized protein C7orf26-like [Saccoglossus kowalevskii]